MSEQGKPDDIVKIECDPNAPLTIGNAPWCRGCQGPIITIHEGKCTRCGWLWNPDKVEHP